MVGLSPNANSGGVPVYLVITLHRPDTQMTLGSAQVPA